MKALPKVLVGVVLGLMVAVTTSVYAQQFPAPIITSGRPSSSLSLTADGGTVNVLQKGCGGGLCDSNTTHVGNVTVIKGGLTVDGGTLTVNGSTLGRGFAEVRGGFLVDGGALTTSGNATIGGIGTVKGFGEVRGGFLVDGGTLTTSGAATIGGNETVSGTELVHGFNEVRGNVLFDGGTVTATGNVTINGTATVTNQATFTRDPTNTTHSNATLYINPATAGAGEPLQSWSVAGANKAVVDAEGDATFASLLAAGTNNFSGINIIGDYRFNSSTPAQITGDLTNYNINSATLQFLSSDASRTINSIVAPSTGASWKWLWNIGSNPIVFAHEESVASTTAANRLSVDTGSIGTTGSHNFTLQPGQSVMLTYGSSRWRVHTASMVTKQRFIAQSSALGATACNEAIEEGFEYLRRVSTTVSCKCVCIQDSATPTYAWAAINLVGTCTASTDC